MTFLISTHTNNVTQNTLNIPAKTQYPHLYKRKQVTQKGMCTSNYCTYTDINLITQTHFCTQAHTHTHTSLRRLFKRRRSPYDLRVRTSRRFSVTVTGLPFPAPSAVLNWREEKSSAASTRGELLLVLRNTCSGSDMDTGTLYIEEVEGIRCGSVALSSTALHISDILDRES
jgi:hypothetical protein